MLDADVAHTVVPYLSFTHAHKVAVLTAPRWWPTKIGKAIRTARPHTSDEPDRLRNLL